MFSECSVRVSAVPLRHGVKLQAPPILDRGTNVDVIGKLRALAALSPHPQGFSPSLASLR